MSVTPRSCCWFTCLMAGLLHSAAAAQRAVEPGLRASDVFALEQAADAQISPDGSRVVYARQFADITTDQRYSNLWLVNADGSGHRPLTSGRYSDSGPRWSPDGTRVLFTSNRDGATQIWVLWLQTGVLSRVTSVARAPGGAAWSPDSRWIAFTSLVPGEARPIATLPKPPAGATWAKPARVFDRLVYQFNDVGELEPGFAQLFVVPAEGGVARQLSSGAYHHGGGPGRGAGVPVWTPDSRHVLIPANRRPDFELESRDTEIYEFEVATGAMRALTDRRGPDNSPAVSADGSWIAYTGFDDRHQGYQVTRLYVMPRGGGGARQLAAELDRDVVNPQWTADGRSIVFQYDDRGNTKIAVIGVAGGPVRPVAANVGTGVSAYPRGTYTLSRTGRIAFPYTTPQVPSDVAVTSLHEPTTRVIVRLNQGLLAQRQLGTVEEIWYPSSKDGRRIQGWIIKPPGFVATRKYPVLLEIHGGPFANYGDRFDLEKQVWAAAGYVVLYTNPRGSTSYGEEFGNLIHHAYPGDDFYDLDAGMDAVLAQGYIDPEQQFVTGGSGGGVLTAWMIGRTQRFRAAVLQYPVINWYSFALSSDIPSTVNRYWFAGPPWEHAAAYHARSVISLVGQVKTPSMIITGEADYRTPMSESEQYYQALRIAGVDAVLVKVPDEPHGITRHPSHHLQKMAYIQGWLDLHRKGARVSQPMIP